MGKEGMVYATPRMVNDVEYACRDLLIEHLDDGEDSVGAHVAIDHLAATPLGFEVAIDVRIVDIEKRRVTFEFTVHDGFEDCGRGRHVRFVADKARSFERIRAKRARAGL
jgi:predicted thioesterase